MDRLASWIPLISQLRHHDRAAWRDDLVAGLTTAIMLIPQAMAYALLAGLDPVVGLYASTLPLLAYSVLGTSRQLAVGPVAMVSLLVASAVAPLADGHAPTYAALAGLLALMVGGLQWAMGLLRVGFLVKFLSHPVIAGFTSAAALIIGFSQLKHVLGIPLARHSHVLALLAEAVNRLSEVNIIAVATAGVSIGVLLLLQRYAPRFPRFLVVVAGGALAVWGLQLPIAVVGDVPASLPRLTLPPWDPQAWRSLLPMAVTIALVGFMESISVAKNFARLHRYDVDPDQELNALGIANVVGGLFGGYPVTGGFSRTAVNAQAGARSGLAGLVTGLAVVVALLLLTPWLSPIPKAVLAAIIMTAVFGLVDVSTAKHLWRVNRGDFALMALTFAATLAVGIEQGILLGVVASLLRFVWQTSRPHVAVLGRVPGSDVYRNVERYPEAACPQDVLAVRIDAPLYFANTAFLQSTLEELAQTRPALAHLVIDAKGIGSVDSQALDALAEVVATFQTRGVTVWLAGVRGPVRDALQRCGLWDTVGPHHIVERVHHAVDVA